VAFLFPPFACGFELSVPLGKDLPVTSLKFRLGRDVADGRMQAKGVVVFDEPADDAACIVQTQGRTRADALFLEDAMPAFDLAVALWVVRRGLDVGHAAEPNELLEITGDELGAVVGDDPRRDAGEAFAGTLNDLLDIDLGHGFANLPVGGETAAAIEQAAQVVERTGDIDVRDIDVPVLVGPQGLHEALALGRGLGSVAVEPARLLEDAVDAGRATSDDVGVNHHEGEPAVALQGKEFLEVEDGFAFLGFEPVVAGDPGIMFVDLAVAVLPRVPLGSGQAQPQQKASDREAGLVGPTADEVNDLIAGIVGNPESGQSSPRSFFSWTCSSMSSERTSCLRRSLAWSSAIC
jgi:hypothetical protein